MSSGKKISGIGIGSLISIAGCISLLVQGRWLDDFKLALKTGPGYLFIIAGLVMVAGSILMTLTGPDSQDIQDKD